MNTEQLEDAVTDRADQYYLALQEADRAHEAARAEAWNLHAPAMAANLAELFRAGATKSSLKIALGTTDPVLLERLLMMGGIQDSSRPRGRPRKMTRQVKFVPEKSKTSAVAMVDSGLRAYYTKSTQVLTLENYDDDDYLLNRGEFDVIKLQDSVLLDARDVDETFRKYDGETYAKDSFGPVRDALFEGGAFE